MNSLQDARSIGRFAVEQAGIFSTGDLQSLFDERNHTAFGRRIRTQLAHGILRRFCRGWYVAEEFSLATLSQRIAPASQISFATVLAAHGIIGTRPEKRIVAIKTGRPRRYTFGDSIIEHVSIAPDLLMDYETQNGVRYVSAEKAVLDTLYYHLRGRRYAFDIYSDLNLRKLSPSRLREYLTRYKNPKFATFAKDLLELHD